MSEKETIDLESVLDTIYNAPSGLKPITKAEQQPDGVWHAYDEDGNLRMICGQSFIDSVLKLK